MTGGKGWHLVDRGQEAAIHPTGHSSLPGRNKTGPPQNVSSAEFEKPWFSLYWSIQPGRAPELPRNFANTHILQITVWQMCIYT